MKIYGTNTPFSAAIIERQYMAKIETKDLKAWIEAGEDYQKRPCFWLYIRCPKYQSAKIFSSFAEASEEMGQLTA